MRLQSPSLETFSTISFSMVCQAPTFPSSTSLPSNLPSSTRMGEKTQGYWYNISKQIGKGVGETMTQIIDL